MKVVFPMAGRGSRFKAVVDTNPEFTKPKPLINVLGSPMITWAVKTLPFIDLPDRPAKTKIKAHPKDLVFICLQEHEDQFSVTTVLKRLFTTEINVILIPEVTRGALETALVAKHIINSDEPVIISDSDHYFDGSFLSEVIENKSDDIKGVIPVFEPPDDEVKWSYSLFDENHKVSAVAEKDPVLAKSGAYANIGAYYFAHGNLFVQEAEEVINSGTMFGESHKREFYVAPLYDQLIKKGHHIKVAITPKVWGLGTPHDLERFVLQHSTNS